MSASDEVQLTPLDHVDPYDIVSGSLTPGAYVISSTALSSGQSAATDIADLAAAVGSTGYRTMVVRGDLIVDKTSLLETFAKACGFPGYSGANYDALSDSLRDLSWHGAEGYLLVVTGAGRIVGAGASGDDDADAAPEWATKTRTILAQTAAWWDDAGTPMWVLLTV